MRVRSAALVLLWLAWLAGAARAAEQPPILALSNEESVRLSSAIEALRTGDWPAAVEGFRSAAARASILSDYATLFLAESLARLGDLAGARRAAQSLVLNDSGSRLVSDALLLTAHLASREGDEAGAERSLRDLLSRVPDSSEAPLTRYLLGLTLETQGHEAEAASTFRDLWLFDPSSAYAEASADRLAALSSRGIVLRAPSLEERLERAERLLTGSVFETARQEAEALLAERPPVELALRALDVAAESLRRLRRFGDAAGAVQRVLVLVAPARRPALLLELARLQHRAGAHGLALGTVERLIRGFPREPEAASGLILKGRILDEAGRPREATRVYQRAVAGFPDHGAAGAALWRLGWLAYLDGDVATAGRHFARLVELPAGHAYRLASAYWAGRSRAALGEHGAARRFFQLLLAEAPRSYYGILASRYASAADQAQDKPPPFELPSDPMAPLGAEPRFAKAEALRALGLGDHANAELAELSVNALSDPLKLYALSALWAREEQYHLALRILRRHFADLAWSGHPGLPRRFWELFYPMSWSQELRQAADRTGLDRYLVAAVVREESSFFPQARSRAGARGLMQLMPETVRPLARRRGLSFGAGDLLDEPGLNLALGAEILAGLLKQFGDPRLALAAYNAGPARVREWWRARRSDDPETFVEQIPFDETRHFVKRVLISWEEYRRIYGAGE